MENVLEINSKHYLLKIDQLLVFFNLFKNIFLLFHTYFKNNKNIFKFFINLTLKNL
jgi:hypothetical protein